MTDRVSAAQQGVVSGRWLVLEMPRRLWPVRTRCQKMKVIEARSAQRLVSGNPMMGELG